MKYEDLEKLSDSGSAVCTGLKAEVDPPLPLSISTPTLQSIASPFTDIYTFRSSVIGIRDLKMDCRML